MATPYSRYIFGTIPWYSVLIVSGILLAYWIGTGEQKRLKLPKDTMLDVTLVAVPCGIVGARLYYVLMSLEQFAANPISVFYIWEGGIAIYGAVIGGGLGVYFYAKRKRLSFGSLLDMVAPGLVLAQALGRWGNYFNQEAFGPVIGSAAWQFFPVGVLIGQGDGAVWHVATFFYESCWDLGCFLVLMLTRKRMNHKGDVFLWYMALYGSGRFLVEQLREDSLYIGGARASQYLSLILCAVVAVCFLCRVYRHASKRAFAACLLGCATMYLRLLLAPAGVTFAVTLALYAASAMLLWTCGETPRYAFWWLMFDLLVYVALALLKLSWLWRSPYFLYAGLAVPVYLSIPYVCCLRAQNATVQEG